MLIYQPPVLPSPQRFPSSPNSPLPTSLPHHVCFPFCTVTFLPFFFSLPNLFSSLYPSVIFNLIFLSLCSPSFLTSHPHLTFLLFFFLPFCSIYSLSPSSLFLSPITSFYFSLVVPSLFISTVPSFP